MKILRLIIMLSLFTNSFSATSQQASKQSSRKVVEFGDVSYESTASYLDAFSAELMSTQNSQAYIVVYRSQNDLPGISLRYALRAKNYLVKKRGLDPLLITAIDGGRDECLRTQLWIVPNGSSPSTPKMNFSYERANLNFTRKFDEYRYYFPQEYTEGDWSVNTEDEVAHLCGFAIALRKEHNPRAVIVAYAQYYENRGVMDVSDVNDVNRKRETETLLDPINTAAQMLENERSHLIKRYNIPASRIVTIDGGYRVDRTVELWIVPVGSPTPNPSPNIYPPKSLKH